MLVELSSLDFCRILLVSDWFCLCGGIVSFRWLFVLSCGCLLCLLYVELRLNGCGVLGVRVDVGVVWLF